MYTHAALDVKCLLSNFQNAEITLTLHSDDHIKHWLTPPLNSSLSHPISTFSFLNLSISSPFTFTKSWHIKDHNWALYKSLFPGETRMPALHRAGEETMEWRTDEEWVEGRWEMEGCMEMNRRWGGGKHFEEFETTQQRVSEGQLGMCVHVVSIHVESS